MTVENIIELFREGLITREEARALLAELGVPVSNEDE